MTVATTAPAATQLTAAARRARRTAAQLLLDAAMAAAVLAFLFLAIGPRVLPYRTVTMLTGSMAPHIPTGAMVVDVAEPLAALRPGQVVSFHAPEPGRPVVTHRVVGVQHRDGQVLIRTRGDANRSDDPWLAVVHGTTVWRERAVVPWLGTAIRALRAPSVHVVVAWLVPGALLAWFLLGVWRRPRIARGRDDVAAPYPHDGGGDRACIDEPVSSASPPSSSAAA